VPWNARRSKKFPKHLKIKALSRSSPDPIANSLGQKKTRSRVPTLTGSRIPQCNTNLLHIGAKVNHPSILPVVGLLRSSVPELRSFPQVHEAKLRLSVQLDIPNRFKAIRADALRNLAPGAEAFAQRNYKLGQHHYLSISLLTDHTRWRGGWLLFLCPPGEEAAFTEYLATARDAIVADPAKGATATWLEKLTSPYSIS
jgi:hypothetical protein